jgi:multidrug resistance efflux pump
MSQPHSRSLRVLFYLLGLGLLIVSTAAAIFANSTGTSGPVAMAQAGGDKDVKNLVCYGYVDVEGGVTPLYPVVPGRVVQVIAKENQKFTEAGKPLLKLDDTLAKERLEEAKADLQAAEDQLEQAKDLPKQHELKVSQQQEAITAADSDLRAAEKGVQRMQELAKIKQKSDEEVEAARQLLRKLKAAAAAEKFKLEELKLAKPELQIRRAEQDVVAKKARVRQAEYGVSECVLTSPCAGVVLQVNVSVGTVLGPNPTQPAVVFCPERGTVIRAEVEQEFANRVAVGRSVEVQPENSDKQSWRGKLTRVADWYTQRRNSQPDTVRISNNDTYTLECLVALDPGQPKLRLGQRVRVLIGKE